MAAEQQRTAPPPPNGVEHFDLVADAYERTTGGGTRAVARHTLQLPALRGLFAAPLEAVVLDNACGTAIVTEEIISRCRKLSADTPVIRAVDPAENMVTLAAAKLAALGVDSRCSTAAMPGERLAFPDETFSHSITNMGILFFENAAAGAHEIRRTLKPGGVAVITTWARLDYVDNVFHPAQARARPGAEPLPVPFDPRWFDPAQVEACMRDDGGFERVKAELYDLHYSAPSVHAICEQLLDLFAPFYQAWTEDERETFRAAVRELTAEVAVPCVHVDGSDGFGVPITAIIAVCVK